MTRTLGDFGNASYIQGVLTILSVVRHISIHHAFSKEAAVSRFYPQVSSTSPFYSISVLPPTGAPMHLNVFSEQAWHMHPWSPCALDFQGAFLIMGTVILFIKSDQS